MSIFTQILLGSLMLGLCCIIHVGILMAAIPATRLASRKLVGLKGLFQFGLLITLVLLFIIAAHTIQVWLWAIFFMVFDMLPTIEEAVYFALATYTTVGYGDVTVGPDFRIFAAMASVIGLLAFGLSTAFLVAFFERIRPQNKA